MSYKAKDNIIKTRAKIASEPARWGEYGSAEAFYASEEWLQIVRDSLDSYRILLAAARRVNQAEAIKFYSHQIAACEHQLHIAPDTPLSNNPAQQSLFDTLLKG